MKPMLFNSQMVRAILDGHKSVTRRIIKPQPTYSPNYGLAWNGQAYGTGLPPTLKGAAYNFRKAAPYQPGDILYVRETWAQPYGAGYKYAADYGEHDIVEADHGNVSVSKNMIKWHPSIHMPRDAARIFLSVKSVHVEQLQDITEDQAEKEGFYRGSLLEGSNLMVLPRGAFASLWDQTIKRSEVDAFGWNANPWVWVIEFERCDHP